MTSTALHKIARPVVTTAALGVALLGFETRAAAQDVTPTNRFGSKGQFAVTAEDLFGIYSDHFQYKDQLGIEEGATTTRFSLLFSTHGGGQNIVTSPASTVGLHYFIIPGLSLGGNIGYESRSGSVQLARPPVSYSQDMGTGSTFIFEPKIGYALMLSDLLGFWFRGGPSVAVDAEYPRPGDPVYEDKYTFWMVSADVLFVVTPVDHFGFYVGPGLDLSFTGTYTHTELVRGVPSSVSLGASYRRFKLGLGMIAYF